MDNSLGERLISDAEELIRSGGDIEDIREAMNAVYHYYKNELRDVRLSDRRLIRVFSLERLLKDRYLPLENEPRYDENEDVSLPSVIQSEEDCQSALRFIVHETRKELSKRHDLKKDSLEKECPGTSDIVGRVCEEHGITYRSFSLNDDLGPGLFHCFDVVSFNVDGETKSYLVDCTYRQFFTYADAFMERIGMPYFGGSSIGNYMMMSDERKSMAEELLVNGYIEFTDEVAKTYFDAMVFANRNGFYYEGLGKSTLSRSDFEPQYTLAEYVAAINNGGLKEENLGRQFGVMKNPNMVFDTIETMPYISRKNEHITPSDTAKKID